MLRANGCDNQFGDEMLVALLEILANNQHRVDLVNKFHNNCCGTRRNAGQAIGSKLSTG
jgi:hypothetical protein